MHGLVGHSPAGPVDSLAALEQRTHVLVLDGHGGHMLDLVDQLVRTFGTAGVITLTCACVYWYCSQVRRDLLRILAGMPRACGSPEDCMDLDGALREMIEWFHGAHFSGLQRDDYRNALEDQGHRQAFVGRFSHVVRRFDFVFCQNPLALCSYFLPAADVRVIARVTHRCDYFACSQSSRDVIGQDLRWIKSRGQVYTSSRLDRRYLHEFYNISAQLWPSLSLYASAPGALVAPPDLPGGPGEEEVLVLPNILRNDYPCMPALQRCLADIRQRALELGIAKRFVHLREAHGEDYELQDLRRHRVALVLPYTTPIAAVDEAHALGLTLLVPSPKLLARWHRREHVLCLLSTPCLLGDDKFKGQSLVKWLRLSEVYRRPGVFAFASIDELLVLVEAKTKEARPTSERPRHLERQLERSAEMLRRELRRQTDLLIRAILDRYEGHQVG